MKIAIASTGNHDKAKLSTIFSRCSWFVFYDTETGAIEYYPNTFMNSVPHAGEEAIKLMIRRKVQIVISGHFGEKVKQFFDRQSVQMVIFRDKDLTVKEILNKLQKRYKED